MAQLNGNQNVIKTLVLDKLTFSDIKYFPIKLQIYFMLRFWNLNKDHEIKYLIELAKCYNPTKYFTEESILKIIDQHNYEITGFFFNSPIYSGSVKTDYKNLWIHFVESCTNRRQYHFTSGVNVKLPFDIIIFMCEIFNISVHPRHIPQLIHLKNYNEDNAIYMLKSSNILFGVKSQNNVLLEFMKVFEIMYDDAVKKEYKVLAKVIRTLPYFVSCLSDGKIIEIVKNYPDVLNYNLNKNPLDFEILKNCNDVISVRLKNLCYDEKLKNFESTNKIISIMLTHKLTVPYNESYNKTFFNYCNKINTELGNNIDYCHETNYSEKMLDLHLKIMGKPLVCVE